MLYKYYINPKFQIHYKFICSDLPIDAFFRSLNTFYPPLVVINIKKIPLSFSNPNVFLFPSETNINNKDNFFSDTISS